MDREYETIPFPFERVKTPRLFIEKRWVLVSFLGYVSTWSAVQMYICKTGADPVEPLGRELASLWGLEEEKTVRWPLCLLLGKVSSSAPAIF